MRRLIFALAVCAWAQERTSLPADVTQPKLLRKVEPKYPEEARKQGIQGSVAIEIVIDERGIPTEITVVSPLGFGLDEVAKEAVEKWRFEPGTKGGKPVRVYSVIEVNFRLSGTVGFDEKNERHRTSFNTALKDLNHTKSLKDRAVKTITDLAHQQYPPAMSLMGTWEINGENVDRNPVDGLEWIQKAAARNNGPALFEIATREIEGRDMPRDVNRGIETMKRAATYASFQAQYNLGQRYEKGVDVAADADRARHYFRLCAAHGVEMCQYRLGKSLVDSPARSDRDYVQGLAWLELAADNKVREAADIVDRELPKLSGPQLASVKSIQGHLVQK
jgi:TonB family protein